MKESQDFTIRRSDGFYCHSIHRVKSNFSSALMTVIVPTTVFVTGFVGSFLFFVFWQKELDIIQKQRSKASTSFEMEIIEV